MTYMLLPVAGARARRVRLPYILTLQDGDPYEKVFHRLRILPFLPIIDWGFRHATVIQAISRYLAEWTACRGSAAPVELVHNGVNPRDLAGTVSQEEIDAAARRLGKQPGDIFLVNTSRLVHQKGSDTIIRALAFLPPTIKLALVGGGEEEDSLKKLAHEAGVSERVVFTGHVDRGGVTAYRRACDIFVAPSRSEGLGNAFLSALASRLPLITTGMGGIADYAIDNETAWLVPVDDPRAIADRVREILDDPHKVQSVADRARAMVEEKYDWDKIATEMRQKVFARAL
jgi:glycosyltransferase involved in cell wall biosynthesis